MINVKHAYKIVLSNNPKMKAFTCIEQEDSYVFSLIPEDLKDDAFANSAVYIINKNNGDYKILPFFEIMDKPIIREIDITTLE